MRDSFPPPLLLPSLPTFKKGAILTGTVRNVTSFGCFLDVGGGGGGGGGGAVLLHSSGMGGRLGLDFKAFSSLLSCSSRSLGSSSCVAAPGMIVKVFIFYDFIFHFLFSF